MNYQIIVEEYVKNLTISYPNIIVEGKYYWTDFSKMLCLALGAFGAFNVYHLFSSYNIFRTLQINTFWNTINIGTTTLPQYLTLFCNKLALIVVIAIAIAYCYMGVVSCLIFTP